METHQSKDHVGSFLEEFREHIIAGVKSPESIMEAWTSRQQSTIMEALTPREQIRMLHFVVEEGTSQSKADFYQILSQEEPELIAYLEQIQKNSWTTQTEEKWTMVDSDPSEDEPTEAKTKSETIKTQIQLVCQEIGEIGQLWEETQTRRNKTDSLTTNSKQKHEDIDRLKAENYEQHLLIKKMSLQIENVTEKLKQYKNEDVQEKIKLVKMQTEICKEREHLERRRNELINEKHKLEIIKYFNTKSQQSKEPKETTEQTKREKAITDTILRLINKNNKIMLEAKQEKQLAEKQMATIKQELERNQNIISHHRDQIERMKHMMNININRMKQSWIQTAAETRTAAVPAMERGTFDTVKVKLHRIQKVMERLGEQLQVTEREKLKMKSYRQETTKSDSQMQTEDTAIGTKITKWQKQKMAQTKDKMQTGRENVKKDSQAIQEEISAIQFDREFIEEQREKGITRVSNTEKEDISRLTQETEYKDMNKPQAKGEEQSSVDIEETFDEDKNKMNTDMNKVIVEIEGIRKMLSRVREDQARAEQSRKDFTEEKKRQIQWMNFQAKKKARELDQRLEKTMRERDEVEVMKVKIQQHRGEVARKLENTRTIIRSMSEIKASMEKAAAEMNHTREEMLNIQTQMDQTKEEVKVFMAQVNTDKEEEEQTPDT